MAQRIVTVQLTSSNSVLRTTITTHIEMQVSTFQAAKSCQVGFDVLRWFYLEALSKSSERAGVSYVYVIHSRLK
jgi:hypothetical protein